VSAVRVDLASAPDFEEEKKVEICREKTRGLGVYPKGFSILFRIHFASWFQLMQL
jgi:hypothetical protein